MGGKASYRIIYIVYKYTCMEHLNITKILTVVINSGILSDISCLSTGSTVIYNVHTIHTTLAFYKSYPQTGILLP